MLARLFLGCPLLALCVDPDTFSVLDVSKLCDGSDSLPRVRGITRLFGALTVALPPPAVRSPRPPYLNPALLWRTVAAISNATWIPSVSAEVIHGLLDTGASVLFAIYGNQTARLLSTITSIIKSSPELSQLIPEISLLSTIESAQKLRSSGLAKARLDASFWSAIQ
ncbi:unnamed protein product [Echinostoma caproni]|uniref:GLE1 RNA export mediator n=1 Tax=Echinostoma caproni TaxID=27848 RepID=A0A3P8FYB9_9TREM|nr:unnamed protein product [Echinostoma caproni]